MPEENENNLGKKLEELAAPRKPKETVDRSATPSKPNRPWTVSPVLAACIVAFAVLIAGLTSALTAPTDRPDSTKINHLLRTPYEIRWFIDATLPNLRNSYLDLSKDASLPEDLEANARRLRKLVEGAVDEHHAILIQQHSDVKTSLDKLNSECPSQPYYPRYWRSCNTTSLEAYARDRSQKRTPRIHQQASKMEEIVTLVKVMQNIIDKMKRGGLSKGNVEETDQSLAGLLAEFVRRPANEAEMKRVQQGMINKTRFEMGGFALNTDLVERYWRLLLERMAALSVGGSTELEEPQSMRSIYKDLSKFLNLLKGEAEDWYEQEKIVTDEFHQRYRVPIDLKAQLGH